MSNELQLAAKRHASLYSEFNDALLFRHLIEERNKRYKLASWMLNLLKMKTSEQSLKQELRKEIKDLFDTYHILIESPFQENSLLIPTAKGFSTRRQGASRRSVYQIHEDGEQHRQQSRKFIREGYKCTSKFHQDNNKNPPKHLHLSKNRFNHQNHENTNPSIKSTTQENFLNILEKLPFEPDDPRPLLINEMILSYDNNQQILWEKCQTFFDILETFCNNQFKSNDESLEKIINELLSEEIIRFFICMRPYTKKLGNLEMMNSIIVTETKKKLRGFLKKANKKELLLSLKSKERKPTPKFNNSKLYHLKNHSLPFKFHYRFYYAITLLIKKIIRLFRIRSSIKKSHSDEAKNLNQLASRRRRNTAARGDLFRIIEWFNDHELLLDKGHFDIPNVKLKSSLPPHCTSKRKMNENQDKTHSSKFRKKLKTGKHQTGTTSFFPSTNFLDQSLFKPASEDNIYYQSPTQEDQNKTNDDIFLV
jgi:hypothetical protein